MKPSPIAASATLSLFDLPTSDLSPAVEASFSETLVIEAVLIAPEVESVPTIEVAPTVEVAPAAEATLNVETITVTVINAPDEAPGETPALIAPVLRHAVPKRFAPEGRPEARWHIPTAPDESDRELAQACGITPVLAAILRARGHASPDAAHRFLNPDRSTLRDPSDLPDLPQAVERLHRAIVGGEQILVCGDYDVDGVTATALLWRSLRDLGANLHARVPERSEGYDLKIPDVEAAAQAGFGLIITADNGIRAIKPVERARELGLDVIITDHHEPGAELPPAFAVVNPKREDSRYGFRELCGCAVAYKLVQALLREHWPEYSAGFERKFMEFAAIATIADCMPLEDENRVLVRDGLTRLSFTKKRGLQALIEAAGLGTSTDFKASDVSFRLAPRINSAGRFSRAKDALDLLMSSDEAQCRALAESIEELNSRRQRIVEEIMSEAIGLVEEGEMKREFALVVAGGRWGHGVVGLVASRLVEMYGRPALVFGEEEDHWRGSGRSIPDFDLMCVIEATRDLQLSGGGHRAACGLSVRKDAMEEFRRRVAECAQEHLADADFAPRVEADVLVTGNDLAPQLVDDLALLQPCGQGNPSARLMLRGARVLNAQTMGANKSHLKWRLKCGERIVEALWWRNADKATRWGSGSQVDICFSPEWNDFRGERNIQLKIEAARDAA